MNIRFKITKSLIAVCMAAVIAAALFVPALAAGGGAAGGLTWKLDGTSLTVGGNGAMPDYSDANMPPWYNSASQITSVTVEEGVTSVGTLAFYNCPSLTAVTLPSTLTAIGDRAFKDCAALSYVNYPAGLKSIGEAAFENCDSLTNAHLPEGLTGLGNMAFYHCVSLSGISVPSTVTDFGKVVFAYCTGLVRAVVRCPVQKLPDWTFYGCTSLISVSLPDELTELGDSAFHDCVNLSAVHYAGEAADALFDRIAGETRITARGGMTDAAIDASSSAYVDNGNEYVTVSDTENALITVRRAVTAGIAQPVGTISAVLYTDAGWNELSAMIGDMLVERTRAAVSDTVVVNVQLAGSVLSGAAVMDLVGEPVHMYVVTDAGARWRINMNSLKRGDIKDRDYALAFSLTEVEDKPEGLVCSRLYRLDPGFDVDFTASLAALPGSSYARRFASLFTSGDDGQVLLDSVVIDTEGAAWFNAPSGESFYLAVDVEGVWAENATVPSGLSNDYGADGENLSDAEGNRYSVGERTSSWGLTGGQFAIIVAGVVFLVVVVISAIMIVRNHNAKLRAERGLPPKEPRSKQKKDDKQDR